MLEINLIECPVLNGFTRVQYRFPKSKKRRIRKKWSKKSSNFHLVYAVNDAMILNKETNTVLMSSHSYKKYKAAIELRSKSV